ncbi:hypothetical protein H4Q26_003535 [Puccinia striiformis f. sp. tritici PST-130]|nr:hypothetical protein H4Q26_003535 [Puccinia striiformis f. sp. tritici PST-130]
MEAAELANFRLQQSYTKEKKTREDTDLEAVIKDRELVFQALDIKSWMLMTMQGLDFCHQNWVLHCVYGTLKIADFGLVFGIAHQNCSTVAEHTQLELICGRMPTDQDWPGHKGLADYVEFPKQCKQPLDLLFSAAGNDAIDFLECCLKFDQRKQINSRHPYNISTSIQPHIQPALKTYQNQKVP